MHSTITGALVILAAAVTGCANPTSPTPRLANDPTVVATLARVRPTGPGTIPDSIGIPPSIPPIFEEAPAELDGAP